MPVSDSGDEALACWIVRPGLAELRAERLPPPGPNALQVRALHSGISRGTEALVFRGEVPPSEYQRMRAPFQVGDFPGPLKYGYSSVGIVERGPADWRGRMVFCLHPHQSRYIVPCSAVHALPQGVPPARAVLAANLETAVNALWDAGPRVGDRISVVGGGTIGLLVAWLAAQMPGCRVQVIDPRPERRAVAEPLGATFATPEQAAGEQDLVVHASGQAAGLATALRLAGFEATVLELSWYGSRSVALPLGEAFHARRLVLRSSQVGHVAASRRARWTPPQRLALALALLADPVLDGLITGAATFAQLPAVLARLSADDADRTTLCQRIDYPDAG